MTNQGRLNVSTTKRLTKALSATVISLLLASCSTTKVIYVRDNEKETLDITSKGSHKIQFSKEGLQIESR